MQWLSLPLEVTNVTKVMRIRVAIQRSFHNKPRRGSGRCDSFDDHLMCFELLFAPVARDVAEPAMFDFVPLAGPGREGGRRTGVAIGTSRGPRLLASAASISGAIPLVAAQLLRCVFFPSPHVVVVELFEAGELVSAAEAIAPFSIETEFDRVFALNSVSGSVSEIPVIRSTEH